MSTTLQLTTWLSGCSTSWSRYSATSTSTTICSSPLVSTRTNHMPKTTVSWRCCLEVLFPTVRETFQRLDVLHALLSPLYRCVKLGAPFALSEGYQPVCLPLLPSSPLSIHILPRPTELSRTYSSFIIDAIGHTNMNISISSCDNPTNMRHNTRPLNSATIRGPHCAEHILRRYRRWTSPRRIQPEHQLHHSGRTGSGQPHGTEKDRFLGGTA